MNGKMRFAAGLLLLLGPVLGLVSCDDTLQNGGNAEVEVTLRIEVALEGTTGMAVWFYCTSVDGKSVVVAAEEVAEGRYLAHLPENSISASPFIKVVTGNTAYSYTPTETRFMAGQRYGYSLLLGPDGLTPAGTGWEIEDWEVVLKEEIEVTMQ